MFDIRLRGSMIVREVLGGATTFMSMSYILFVQPVILSQAEMDEGGVFMATCISSAAACILMGLLANYPIALAPGGGGSARRWCTSLRSYGRCDTRFSRRRGFAPSVLRFSPGFAGAVSGWTIVCSRP